MICPNCKTELEDGLVHCPICNHALQIVPDYNSLDDEIPHVEGGRQSIHKAKKPKKKISKKVVLFLLALIAILALVWYLYVCSFSYQYAAGRKADANGDYNKAMSHYLNALHRDDSDPRILAALGNDAMHLGKKKTAESYLLSAVKKDGNYARAFTLLLTLYEQEGNYEKMQAALSYATTNRTKEIFADYLILPPVLSQAEGKYDDDVELTLTPPEGEDYDIFYTTDGSSPNSAGGRMYQEPILLTEGKTVVKAVCRNKNGKFGQVIRAKYKITYKEPSAPQISPDGGTFHEKTKVTILSENEDDEIYYTWDGSDPTDKSRQYTAPIVVPDGNQILSVIVIDRHGKSSKIVRSSFKYDTVEE